LTLFYLKPGKVLLKLQSFPCAAQGTFALQAYRRIKISHGGRDSVEPLAIPVIPI